MASPVHVPRVLSIAGSDSGGGAGIQADLKAFAACRVHGMTSITAITAQNTVGVSAVHAVPPDVIIAQVRAVAGDIGVDAVKIGMLGDLPTIRAVARALDELTPRTPVVLDPVMVAESGAPLLEPSARAELIHLLARATVATPNFSEAHALLREANDPEGASATLRSDGEADAAMLARQVHALGPAVVVVTGGHRDQATDIYFDGEILAELPGERYPGRATHGSGCTHSSVLAARLAMGDEPLQAARVARALAGSAVSQGLADLGEGAGPVDILGIGDRRKERHEQAHGAALRF